MLFKICCCLCCTYICVLCWRVRKKDKFAAQKLSMEQEMKTLSDKLSEGRVVEEGIR